jgi:inorganic phosphate transporter, PiT family
MSTYDATFAAFVFGVALSYAYAFVSGFTDAANAIATAVGTRAFTPAQAVAVAGVLELAGALTGTAVASTIGQGIVSPGSLSQLGVCAALLATLGWSLITFWRGIPVSETHGLVGGIIGAALAAGGGGVVQWGSVATVTLAIVVSPLLGFAGAVVLLVLIYRVFARVERSRALPVFVHLQRLSAAYMAFSHGRNDAQKPMGVLALMLATHYGWQTLVVPLWVIVSVAAVAALGVASGGWRIIRTLGLRVTGLDSVQGFAAEMSAASVLQVASSVGVPVSTTHAITSAIVGAGTVLGRTRVRWRLVAEISLSWLLTLPVTVLLGIVFRLLLELAFGAEL